MKEMFVRFLREEEGQDMVEYTLLLAFVCLASAALFIGAGKQVSGIWSGANTLLVQANAAAAGAGGGGS
jgi:Flp pilus assembly pilin Flp